MAERAIHISSVERENFGVSECENFSIKFTPPIELDANRSYEVAVDKVSMTYSWHNISSNYNNKVIKYSHDNGSTWTTVTFPNGMYSYSDIDDYLHRIMKINNHNNDDKYDINIIFVLTTYKVIIELSNNYQVDLRNTNFGELIGFEPKIITSTEEGSKLPNITNSVDSLHINTDLISDSIVGGINSNTLFVIPTGTLRRSFPFVIEPKRALYSEITKKNISRMRFYVTDSLRRPVYLNGIDWNMTIIIREGDTFK